MNRFGLLAAACAMMFCASTARGVLVNQYTFNGNANDSGPGAQNATVVDPSSISRFVGGQLDLTANNGVLSNTPAAGAFVNLPNGIVSAALAGGTPNAASFEMWVTVQENRFWARLFDFGSSNAGEDTSVAGSEQDYLQLVAQGFNDTYAFESHPAFAGSPGVAGSGLVAPVPPTRLTTGVQHHIVVTYDQNDLTAGAGGTAKIYLNNAAALVGPISTSMPLGSLANENNDWLGRAQWNDPLIDGLYNEFRIYNHALTSAEVAANDAAGPVPAPVPILLVNRDTGVITIQNNTGSAQQLTGYSLTSVAGGLNITPLWDPIAPASGWTIQTQLATNIAETGGTAVNLASGGGSVSLGNAWIKSPIEDVAFSFNLSGGGSGIGAVQYTGNGGAAFRRSDLNTDGAINVSDWTLFLTGNGTNIAALSDVAQSLKGDLNGDNVNNHADFLLFRQDYIAANGLAAFAALTGAVPEPSTSALVALASLVVSARSRRRRQ